MIKLKAKIFDHTNYRFWKECQKVANDTFALADSSINFNVVQSKLPIKWGAWDGTKHRVDKEWFKETFTKNAEGYDFVIVVYDKDQFDNGGRNTLNGQSIDKNYGVSEVVLAYNDKSKRDIGDGVKVKDIEGLLIHELGHGLADHILGDSDKYDKVHYYAEDKDNLRDFYRFIKQPLNNMTDIDWNSDLDILTRTLVGEYGSGNYSDLFAVACVIRNRTINRSGWGSTYRATCLQPWQFSCWNTGTPDRARLITLKRTDSVYTKCLQVAKDIIGGKADVTVNADHYLNKAIVIKLYKKLPTWVDETRHTVKVGEHDFYNLAGVWQPVENPRDKYIRLSAMVFKLYKAKRLPQKVAIELLQILNLKIQYA